MANRTLARRYAAAIFALANDASSIEATGKDLHAIHEALYVSEDVRRFYLSPIFERTTKVAALEKALAGKAGDLALRSVLLLVRKRRESLLPEIVTEYDAIALAASGKSSLEIVSARDLSGSELDDLVGRLQRSYGKQFEVEHRTDPALLGGVRITIGDRRIDNSLAGRLEELARDLATAGADTTR